MSTKAQTRDLGIAIRDFLDDQDFHLLKETDDGLEESGDMREVVDIDASDPNNLFVLLDNRQTFIIRIVAGE